MSGTDGLRSEDLAPAISVLVPVYNGRRFIAETIESVLAQTFDDFELLLFDDGSTDDSLFLLRRYELKDSRIRIFSRENKGISATRNELVSRARGRYLAVLDHDDLCFPQRFERQVAFLEVSPDCVAVGAWVETVNAGRQPIGVIRPPMDHDSIDSNNLAGHCSIWHPASMIRRHALVAVGGYRDGFDSAADFDLWLRLGEIGKLANIPEVLLQYRIHDDATSEHQLKTQRDIARKSCEDAWSRRGISGTFEPTGHWRAGGDGTSRHEFALKYGWTAWAHGHRGTWWTYARQALRLRPLAWSSWNLLFFGFFKSPGH